MRRNGPRHRAAFLEIDFHAVCAVAVPCVVALRNIDRFEAFADNHAGREQPVYIFRKAVAQRQTDILIGIAYLRDMDRRSVALQPLVVFLKSVVCRFYGPV